MFYYSSHILTFKSYVSSPDCTAAGVCVPYYSKFHSTESFCQIQMSSLFSTSNDFLHLNFYDKIEGPMKFSCSKNVNKYKIMKVSFIKNFMVVQHVICADFYGE